MILVDTSIWIEFYKNHEPYFTHLRYLLEKQAVIAISPVFGELLQGVKSKNEKTVLMNYWSHLPKANESELFIRAGEYSSENNLIDKGIGIIDACLLVSAIENEFSIWTLDVRLRRVLTDKVKYSV